MNAAVSVIVPAFNRAKWLPLTLDSIFQQTLSPAEVIVVDDGSTDDTAEVIRNYGSGVKYISIPNTGVCRARNAGVQASACPWIAFCDSDDLWLPEKLERQWELIQRSPEIEYCFTNFRLVERGVWAAKDKLSEAPRWFDNLVIERLSDHSLAIKEPLYRKLITFTPIFPSTVLLTRGFFDRIGGFDERFNRVTIEDYEFTLRCAQETPIGVVTDAVVGIRKHDTNLSGKKLPDLVGGVTILKHALKEHRLSRTCEQELLHEIAARSSEAADLAFLMGDIALARQLLNDVPRSLQTPKLRLKKSISRLPKPIAKLANASILLFARTIRQIGRSSSSPTGTKQLT